ncbi:hypothetical protein PAMP_004211 [Pampus punctatissimus]
MYNVHITEFCSRVLCSFPPCQTAVIDFSFHLKASSSVVVFMAGCKQRSGSLSPPADGCAYCSCRYVVRKIRAAAGGEEQPAKTSTASCNPAKARRDDRMDAEPALIPRPTEAVDVVQKEQCGS